MKINSHPTQYWHVLKDRRVQCDLCPRFCKLHEGQRGLCFVRKCENEQIVLTTWGRSSGFCIDPIEKKPLNHFLPGSAVLSFGTAGCNLACKFCQNWDMSKSREMDTLMDEASPEKIAHIAKAHECQSVAYTYNDPVIFLEYAVDVAHACAEKGINSVAVSAGYITEKPREILFSAMHAANIDLKSFNETFYRKLCGGHLSVVLETLQYLKQETSVWFEITTLLIPGENDSDAEIHKLCAWIVEHLGEDIPLHFSAFHPDWKMMNIPATPPQTLIRARDIALEYGIRYVYTGNIRDKKTASSWCPVCGALLIERDVYVITQWHLTDIGNCSRCGHHCAGVFNEKAGNWGGRRQVIRMS